MGKLGPDATVADVGCAYGHSVVLMAEAFPRSRFYGFDPARGFDRGGAGDCRRSRRRRPRRFRAGGRGWLRRRPYQLICFFDSLHDLAIRSRRSGTPPQCWRQTGQCSW